MKWIVTYRAKDGALREECVEAADRAKCVTECRSRGIAPVRIVEGKGRDRARPSRAGGTGDSKRTTARWVAAAALVVVAIGGGVWWWMAREGEPKKTASVQQQGVVKPKGRDGVRHSRGGKAEETAKPSTGAPAVKVNVQDAPSPAAATNEVAGVKTNRRFRVIRKDAGKKKLFHNIADIYISRVVNSKPGNLVVGTLNYDRFEEQFRKALEQPITFDEDDTPEDVAKKQAVIDTRAELKKMLDRGEDIAKVMREAEAEGRRLWEYRRSLHMEIAKAMKEGKFKADDMQDYVDAANLMLKNKGLSPLKYPQFWVNSLRQREAEAAGASEQPGK